MLQRAWRILDSLLDLGGWEGRHIQTQIMLDLSKLGPTTCCRKTCHAGQSVGRDDPPAQPTRGGASNCQMWMDVDLVISKYILHKSLDERNARVKMSDGWVDLGS